MLPLFSEHEFDRNGYCRNDGQYDCERAQLHARMRPKPDYTPVHKVVLGDTVRVLNVVITVAKIVPHGDNGVILVGQDDRRILLTRGVLIEKLV